MKPLTIEELKALPVGDWVYVCIKNRRNSYCQISNVTKTYITVFWGLDCQSLYYEDDYGELWFAYKNKEQAESKGEIVELPKFKYAITIGAKDIYGKDNYLIESLVPYAEYYSGKWHIGYKEIEWRTVIEEYDTLEEAERRLAELQGE